MVWLPNHSDEWHEAKKTYDSITHTVDSLVDQGKDPGGYWNDLQTAVNSWEGHGATSSDTRLGRSLLSQRYA